MLTLASDRAHVFAFERGRSFPVGAKREATGLGCDCARWLVIVDSASPSSHSFQLVFTRAATTALVACIFPARAADFGGMRDEAGISRLYGGIHYTSDIVAVKAHGDRSATYTLTFARTDGAP